MTKYISVAGSKAYESFIQVCDNHKKLTKKQVNRLIWLLNPEPELTGFIRVISNLLIIIKEVENSPIQESVGTDELLIVIEEMLKISDTLKAKCGTQLDIKPEYKGKDQSNHPFHQLCLTKYPLYSILWNKANSKLLEEKLIKLGFSPEIAEEKSANFERQFKLLQWHLFYAHYHLTKENIDFKNYLPHKRENKLLGDFHDTFYQACQSTRDYCLTKNYEKLSRLNVTQNSKTFFSYMHHSLSDELDELAAPFKTLGTKIDKSSGYLRSPSTSKRKKIGPRKKSTSHLIEDFRPEFELYEENKIKGEREPRLRKLKTWGKNDGWEESDLEIEEQEDEAYDSIRAETECKARRSKKDQIMAAIGLTNKRAILNQHLPIQYNLMTIAEIASAMRILGDLIRDDRKSLKSKKVAALGILMYWTGSTVKRMRNLVVVPPEATLGDSVELAYIFDKKAWRIKVPIYNPKKITSEEQELLCRLNGEFLYLQDFWQCDRFINRVADQIELKSKKVFRPFKKHNTKTYESVLRNIFKDSNNSGLRINHHYLSRDLGLRLLATGDSIDAMMLTGNEYYSSRTQRHYTTPSFRHLTNTYSKVVIPLLNKIRAEKYTDRNDLKPLAEIKINADEGAGAVNCPTITEVNNVINRIACKIKKSNTHSDYHKYYTMYVTFVILYSTGYRAVKDINMEEKLRDPETEFAWISDKDNKDGYHTRRIFLSKTLEKQLKDYDEYRKIIISTWEIQFPKVILPNTDTLPYLFLIDDKNKIVPISPSSMDGPLEKLEYPLPLNSNRRLLRTELLERGCPIDVLNTFMGHWSYGQEPHSPYSCLSPRYQKSQLKKYLIPLLDEIGLKVIHHKWNNH